MTKGKENKLRQSGQTQSWVGPKTLCHGELIFLLQPLRTPSQPLILQRPSLLMSGRWLILKYTVTTKVIFVAETRSHIGLTWNKAYSVANQWVYLMNYKTYILKRYSRRFPKIQPDHGVGLISQQFCQGPSDQTCSYQPHWRVPLQDYFSCRMFLEHRPSFPVRLCLDTGPPSPY